MIPIQCPRCRRSGNVPPDRLNARLVCKGCQAVFHMDSGGRMILGEPGTAKKTKEKEYAGPAVEFDLAETWRSVPRPAKVGVPSMLVLLAGWMWFPGLSAGTTYEASAEAIGRALLRGDKAGVVARATPASADAAGRLYELIHAPIAAKGPEPGVEDAVSTSLIDGNSETGSELSVSLTLRTDGTSVLLQMVKDAGAWKFDAARTLEEATRAANAINLVKKR